MPEQTEEKEKSKGGDQDLLGNLKAEMNRKIDSVKDALAQTTNDLKAQLSALIPKEDRGTQSKSEGKRSFKDLIWDNEEEAANVLKEEAKREIRQEIQAEQRKNQVIGNLALEYPELRDMSHSLTKKAIEIYNAMPEAERDTAQGYKLAVLEAVQQEGIVPMSKRTRNEDDDFVADGSGSAGRKSSKKREPELSEETLQFAETMGLDTSDEKVMERLKKRASRKNWQEYRKV